MRACRAAVPRSRLSYCHATSRKPVQPGGAMRADRAAVPRSRLSYSHKQQPWARIVLQPSHTAYCHTVRSRVHEAMTGLQQSHAPYCHAVSSCVPAAMTGLQPSHTPYCHAVRNCVYAALTGLQQSRTAYCHAVRSCVPASSTAPQCCRGMWARLKRCRYENLRQHTRREFNYESAPVGLLSGIWIRDILPRR